MITACIATLLINVSGEPFGNDKRDVKALKSAYNTCSTNDRYKDTPCLKYFNKRESGVYWAVCSEKDFTIE
jgi:hypothetical protein